MPALFEYANVQNTAIKSLIDKGFDVWYDVDSELYCAQKNGWDFVGESPCSLLGLVSIYEQQNPKEYQEYWWRTTQEDYIRKLPITPPEFESVIFSSKK